MTVNWNNTLLEPVLITFNRALQVNKTLQAFLTAGLTSMHFHVLDNCSTDNTREIVEQIQQQWPNLHYHCNPYNIGGNANILRSVELSNAEYHWVIGDDDEWHLENIQELATILASKEADIIRLGWLATAMSRSKLYSANFLMEQENLFFGSISMISATVLRRTLVTKYLRQAYSNISNFYPQLIPVILMAEEKNVTVYTLKNNLMQHIPSTDPGVLIGDLQWYTVWYKTSLFFNQKKLRQHFNQETLHYIALSSKNKRTRLPCWLFLIRQVLNFKSLGFSQTRYFVEIFLYGSGVRSIFLLPAICYFLTPAFICKGLRKIYQKLYHLPENNIRRDDSRS